MHCVFVSPPGFSLAGDEQQGRVGVRVGDGIVHADLAEIDDVLREATRVEYVFMVRVFEVLATGPGLAFAVVFSFQCLVCKMSESAETTATWFACGHGDGVRVCLDVAAEQYHLPRPVWKGTHKLYR